MPLVLVDTLEAAVGLCQRLHNQKSNSKIQSVNHGLSMQGKDRQTLQQFKHTFCMHSQNCRTLKDARTIITLHFSV